MDIPRCTGAFPPPCWRPLETIEKGRSATLICPQGHHGTLTDHDIGADGTVTPSAVCPHDGCTFHENVRLVDW